MRSLWHKVFGHGEPVAGENDGNGAVYKCSAGHGWRP